jgi:hypothetical protein
MKLLFSWATKIPVWVFTQGCLFLIDRENTGESEVQAPKSGGEVLPISHSTFPSGTGIGRSVFDLPVFLWFSSFISRADSPRFHEHSGG